MSWHSLEEKLLLSPFCKCYNMVCMVVACVYEFLRQALPAREPTGLPLPLFQQEYMGQGSISVCVQMHLLCELSAQALSPLSTCLCSAELNLSRREDSCCCLPCGIEVQSRAGS